MKFFLIHIQIFQNIVEDYPTLLAINADLWICNLYSTTCGDAFYQDVPTIEYTEYNPKVLRNLKNSSMGKEFINIFIDKSLHKDSSQFLINSLLNLLKKDKNKKLEMKYGLDQNNLIHKLTSFKI